MTSTNKLTANRKNALLSRGPKTKEGRMAASKNALKHGVLSKEILIAEEEFSQLNAFATGLRNSLRPQDEIEQFLAERVISCAWRLKRVLKIEASLLSENDSLDSFLGLSSNASKRTEGEQLLLFSRYETALERSLYKALRELRQMQSERGAIEVNGFVS